MYSSRLKKYVWQLPSPGISDYIDWPSIPNDHRRASRSIRQASIQSKERSDEAQPMQDFLSFFQY